MKEETADLLTDLIYELAYDIEETGTEQYSSHIKSMKEIIELYESTF